MSFKTMLEEDLVVFFEAEELAEKIVVQGINGEAEITGFLTENKKYPSKSDQYGVFTEKKILTMKKADWQELGSPSFGYTLHVNEENYLVKEVNYKNGVVSLNLEGVRS